MSGLESKHNPRSLVTSAHFLHEGSQDPSATAVRTRFSLREAGTGYPTSSHTHISWPQFSHWHERARLGGFYCPWHLKDTRNHLCKGRGLSFPDFLYWDGKLCILTPPPPFPKGSSESCANTLQPRSGSLPRQTEQFLLTQLRGRGTRVIVSSSTKTGLP